MTLTTSHGVTEGVTHSDDNCAVTNGQYASNFLWESIHAHPDFHELARHGEDEDHGEAVDDLLIIIGKSANTMCSACRERLIKEVYLELALHGAVETAEAADVNDHQHDSPTIIQMIAAPDGLWMNGFGDESTKHFRTAFFVLMQTLDGDIHVRWAESRSIGGSPLDDDTATRACPDAAPGDWQCPGH